jgi:hypothetical protein
MHRHAVVFFLVAMTAACGGIQPQRGPDGTPVFRGDAFPREPGAPFWCFRYVLQSGEEDTMCRGSQADCAGYLRHHQLEGFAILGGCELHEQVSCVTYYYRTGTQTLCHPTEQECARSEDYFLRTNGTGRDQVTRCMTIDPSFPVSTRE